MIAQPNGSASEELAQPRAQNGSQWCSAAYLHEERDVLDHGDYSLLCRFARARVLGGFQGAEVWRKEGYFAGWCAMATAKRLAGERKGLWKCGLGWLLLGWDGRDQEGSIIRGLTEEKACPWMVSDPGTRENKPEAVQRTGPAARKSMATGCR